MISQQLLDYIKQQRQQGVSSEKIRNSLIANGWQPSDIDQVFSTTDNIGQVSPLSVKPHKRHLALKVVFAILIAPFVLAALFVITINILGLMHPDSPPPDDSDLSLPVVNIPDGQNSFFDLTKAVPAVDTLQSATSSDSERNAALMSLNASLEAAAQKQFYQDPASADPREVTYDTILPPLNSFRHAFKFNDDAALSVASSGNPAAGINTAMLGVKVAQQMENAQGDLIEWLVPVAIKTDALQTMIAIATSSTVNPKDLIADASVLTNYNDDGSGLVRAFKGEYYMHKSTIEGITHDYSSTQMTSDQSSFLMNAQKVDRTNFYWHPNELLAMDVRDNRERIQNAETPCVNFHIDTAYEARIAREKAAISIWSLLFTPNAAGIIVHGIIDSTLDTVNIKRCNENTILAATQLVFGLKAYEQNHHALPATLDDLVPQYLSVLPLDPYSGRAFVYQPEQKRFYSVGSNHEDVGGSPGADPSLAKNPTFTI
ncbi:MAG: hypothetical protein ACYC6X_00985 [Minisyncoccota bacterium]